MIFPVKKKSDYVAARLAKSAEAWKKKEEIEALQEEIKREKDGGGGGCHMSMWSHACRCVCVCVSTSEKDPDERLCVCVRAHEPVHHNEKKVPDKIATTTSDTSDPSRNQEQAQCKGKFNMRKWLVFFFLVNHCHLYRKREKQYTKPTHVSVYLFQDLDWSRL